MVVNPMPSTTVLVTGVGSTTALSVIKGLRQQDAFPVRIIGTDTHPHNLIAGSAFCDRFYTVPPADDSGYLAILLEICLREQAQVLIPIIDPELLVLSEAKDRFATVGVTVVVSDPDTIRVCNDKYATADFFRRHGIPTPDTWLSDELPATEDLPYPLFVKPRRGMSSRDAFRVDSPQELRQAQARVPDLIVQRCLIGEEYTTDLLADLNGDILSVVPRLRLETKAGIIYKGRTCHHDTLISWGQRIGKALKIKGPANLQCIVTSDDPSYFEVNPRFSAGLPLTIAAGVNGPSWLLRLMAGERPPQGLLPFIPVMMTRYWSEVFHPVDSTVQQPTLPEEIRSCQ
jgi:carbamoyl-phosphate synthase large subunit